MCLVSGFGGLSKWTFMSPESNRVLGGLSGNRESHAAVR